MFIDLFWLSHALRYTSLPLAVSLTAPDGCQMVSMLTDLKKRQIDILVSGSTDKEVAAAKSDQALGLALGLVIPGRFDVCTYDPIEAMWAGDLTSSRRRLETPAELLAQVLALNTELITVAEQISTVAGVRSHWWFCMRVSSSRLRTCHFGVFSPPSSAMTATVFSSDALDRHAGFEGKAQYQTAANAVLQGAAKQMLWAKSSDENLDIIELVKEAVSVTGVKVSDACEDVLANATSEMAMYITSAAEELVVQAVDGADALDAYAKVGALAQTDDAEVASELENARNTGTSSLTEFESRLLPMLAGVRSTHTDSLRTSACLEAEIYLTACCCLRGRGELRRGAHEDLACHPGARAPACAFAASTIAADASAISADADAVEFTAAAIAIASAAAATATVLAVAVAVEANRCFPVADGTTPFGTHCPPSRRRRRRGTGASRAAGASLPDCIRDLRLVQLPRYITTLGARSHSHFVFISYRPFTPLFHFRRFSILACSCSIHVRTPPRVTPRRQDGAVHALPLHPF